jgi:ABC-type nitrate/sulfonate/bicarbonate transport system substrate-binding protein
MKKILLSILSLFFITLPFQNNIQSSEPLKKVTLQLKWFHQFQFAGYYAAIEKGFYKEYGFDVSLKEGDPKIHVDDEILNGNADFGILGSELLTKISKGQKLIIIAPIIQHSTRALYVKKSSHILYPENLINKTIAIDQRQLKLSPDDN